MRSFLVLILMAALTGCASTPKPVAYDCPVIALPPDPVPEVSKLTVKSTDDEIIKAWVITAIQYREWNIIVRRQIAASS